MADLTLIPIEVSTLTPTAPSVDKLTTVSMTGEGVFDVLMQAVKLHLTEEYDNNRIVGKEYSQVYLGALTAVMQQSVAYLLNSSQVDQINAQIGLIRQQIATELAKTDDVIPDDLAFNSSADVLGQMKVEKELAAANIAKTEAATINETNLAVSTVDVNDEQILLLTAQTTKTNTETTDNHSKVLVENSLITQQTDKLVTDASDQYRKITSDISLNTAQETKMTNDTIDQTRKVTSEIALIGEQADKIAMEIVHQANKIDADISYLGKQEDKIDLEISALPARNTAEIGLINKQVDKLSMEITYDPQKINAEIALLGQQKTKLISDASDQADKVISDNLVNDSQRSVHTAQINKMEGEILLLGQKTVSELANTCDTIPSSSGQPWLNNTANVQGNLGKQNALYEAQKEGFARDAEQKLAKIMVDTWSVRMASDSGTPLADSIGNDEIGYVLSKAKAGIGI